jgi:glycosyltransferase involved in cell wall biosynthesis
LGAANPITVTALIYNPYWDTLGGGERYTATAIKTLLDANYVVSVVGHSDIAAKVMRTFGIDISKSQFIDLPKYISSDVLLWVSDGSLPSSWAKKTLIHFQFPFSNVHGRSFSNFVKSRFYKFIVNSQFTKKFIDAEFLVNSEVLYPPVDINKFFPSEHKLKQILYVGRFSNLTQLKGQTYLIETFRQIADKLPGWRLILAGGTAVGTTNKELNSLKQLAGKSNIEFIFNPDFFQIQKLYSESKIYWSASGFSADEQKNPTKVEHFGMTVVEAMAAGCVPVITNLGGHKEIIESGLSGFFFTSLSQLAECTLQLIKDEDYMSKFSQAAQKRSKLFSVAQFNSHFLSLIA